MTFNFSCLVFTWNGFVFSPVVASISHGLQQTPPSLIAACSKQTKQVVSTPSTSVVSLYVSSVSTWFYFVEVNVSVGSTLQCFLYFFNSPSSSSCFCSYFLSLGSSPFSPLPPLFLVILSCDVTGPPWVYGVLGCSPMCLRQRTVSKF